MTEQTSKTALGKIFSKKPSFLFVVSKKAVNLHPVKQKNVAAIAQLVEQRIRAIAQLVEQRIRNA